MLKLHEHCLVLRETSAWLIAQSALAERGGGVAMASAAPDRLKKVAAKTFPNDLDKARTHSHAYTRVHTTRTLIRTHNMFPST